MADNENSIIHKIVFTRTEIKFKKGQNICYNGLVEQKKQHVHEKSDIMRRIHTIPRALKSKLISGQTGKHKNKMERKIPMFEKVKKMLVHPATPVAAAVLLGIADSFLRRTEANTLHFLVYLILTAVVVISTLINLAHYGKAMKIISLGLCMVCLACLYTDFIRADNQQSVSAGISSGSGIYQYSDPISFGGNNNSNRNNSDRTYSDRSNSDRTYSDRSNSGKTCYSCNGTKKCHVCGGKGSFYCDGLYCLRGKCTGCNGTGLYDHGSYVSKCLTCSGDGICNICNGTRRYDCSICHGSGKCTNCR